MTGAASLLTPAPATARGPRVNIMWGGCSERGEAHGGPASEYSSDVCIWMFIHMYVYGCVSMCTYMDVYPKVWTWMFYRHPCTCIGSRGLARCTLSKQLRWGKKGRSDGRGERRKGAGSDDARAAEVQRVIIRKSDASAHEASLAVPSRNSHDGGRGGDGRGERRKGAGSEGAWAASEPG